MPPCKKGGHEGLLFESILSVDNYLAVHSPIVIPTAMPSAAVVTTDNHRTAFAVDSSKPAIVVAVADPYVEFLCECGDCNAQSNNRRNNKKTAPHRTISFSWPF
jgi:hypothetical protein